MADINSLDLAFVVDTTGSMGPFLQAAQRQMIAMIDAVSTAAAVHLRLGLVEYRDHPPQDQMVYRLKPFTDNLTKAQKSINALAANGGGDGPEAVFDGILAACQKLEWRRHARRIAVLVGDAPPHGVGASGDHFRGGCPCGQTIASVTAAAEEQRVTLYALGLLPEVAASFGLLAKFTGGEYFAAGQSEAAIEHLKSLLQAEFGNLEFDGRALAEWEANPELSFDDLAARLKSTPGQVAAAYTRLSARRLVGVGARPSSN
jgi:hypothetical protein